MLLWERADDLIFLWLAHTHTQILIEEGVVSRLCLLTHHSDETIRLNSLWALMVCLASTVDSVKNKSCRDMANFCLWLDTSRMCLYVCVRKINPFTFKMSRIIVFVWVSCLFLFTQNCCRRANPELLSQVRSNIGMERLFSLWGGSFGAVASRCNPWLTSAHQHSILECPNEQVQLKCLGILVNLTETVEVSG